MAGLKRKQQPSPGDSEQTGDVREQIPPSQNDRGRHTSKAVPCYRSYSESRQQVLRLRRRAALLGMAVWLAALGLVGGILIIFR